MYELRRTGKQTEHVTGNVIGIKAIIFETLISKKELVVALGVSSSFVSKLMVEERLPYFKIGRAVRFRFSDIVSWLEMRRVPLNRRKGEDKYER